MISFDPSCIQRLVGTRVNLVSQHGNSMAGEDVCRNLNDFNVSKDAGWHHPAATWNLHGNLQCLHGNQFVSVSGRMMRALSPWLTDTSKLLSD